MPGSLAQLLARTTVRNLNRSDENPDRLRTLPHFAVPRPAASTEASPETLRTDPRLHAAGILRTARSFCERCRHADGEPRVPAPRLPCPQLTASIPRGTLVQSLSRRAKDETATA